MKFHKINIDLILFSIMLIPLSCSNDEVIQSPCLPNGVSIPGSDECLCGIYYEGEFCEIELREKFIGRWIGYGHNCTHKESIPDGFVVDFTKTNDVSKVRIESQGIFNNDNILVNVADVGLLNFEEFVTIGSKVVRAFAIDIVYDQATEELSVSIADNEDLDDIIDMCSFNLRRE